MDNTKECKSTEDQIKNQCGYFHMTCDKCKLFSCNVCHGIFSKDTTDKVFLCGSCSERKIYYDVVPWNFERKD